MDVKMYSLDGVTWTATRPAGLEYWEASPPCQWQSEERWGCFWYGAKDPFALPGWTVGQLITALAQFDPALSVYLDDSNEWSSCVGIGENERVPSGIFLTQNDGCVFTCRDNQRIQFERAATIAIKRELAKGSDGKLAIEVPQSADAAGGK